MVRLDDDMGSGEERWRVRLMDGVRVCFFFEFQGMRLGFEEFWVVFIDFVGGDGGGLRDTFTEF